MTSPKKKQKDAAAAAAMVKCNNTATSSTSRSRGRPSPKKKDTSLLVRIIATGLVFNTTVFNEPTKKEKRQGWLVYDITNDCIATIVCLKSEVALMQRMADGTVVSLRGFELVKEEFQLARLARTYVEPFRVMQTTSDDVANPKPLDVITLTTMLTEYMSTSAVAAIMVGVTGVEIFATKGRVCSRINFAFGDPSKWCATSMMISSEVCPVEVGQVYLILNCTLKMFNGTPQLGWGKKTVFLDSKYLLRDDMFSFTNGFDINKINAARDRDDVREIQNYALMVGGSLDYTFRIRAWLLDFLGDLVGLICGHPVCHRILKNEEPCPNHTEAPIEDYVVQLQLSHTNEETTACPGYFRVKKDIATAFFGMTASEYVDLEAGAKDALFYKFFDKRYTFTIKVSNANTLFPQKTILSITPIEE